MNEENDKFREKVLEYINKEKSNLIEEREIIMEFKNKGGTQENAEKILNEIAVKFSGKEKLQDIAYDFLDIITGWISSNLRVW